MTARAPLVLERTPPGRGAVSVLVVRGPEAAARVAALLPAGALPPPAEPRPLRLAHRGEALDHAIVLVRGPDEVELHVHGSPAVVARVRAALGAGADAARGPARTVEERALARLAGATGEDAARLLLDQAEGALRRALDRLVLAPPERWRAGLARLLARAPTARALADPPLVVLAGPVNAGKSTLFNVLVGHERVVAAAEEGTTRDAVTERVRLGAYEVRLVDTAGERPLAGGGGAAEVERAGQALARAAAAEAALVLRLRPAGAAPPAARARAGAGPPEVVLTTFADRVPPAERARLARPLSAPHDPEGARRTVERAVREALALPERPWTPGAAAPFAPDLEQGLVALAGVTRTSERRRAVLRLLGPSVVARRVPLL